MKKFNKIFGVGAQRTGTTSLTIALEELGIKTSHWRHHKELTGQIKKGNYKFDLLKRFDAITDNPIPSIYKELDKEYPGSKFILTVRDKKSWFQSVKFLHKRRFYENKPEKYHYEEYLFYGTKKFKKKVFIKKYLEHNKEVLRYFKDRPDDLLIMNFNKGDRWEKLCNFLHVPIPNKEFPHTNKGWNLLHTYIDKKMGIIGIFLKRNIPPVYYLLKKLI